MTAALITGATRGLGRETARQLAARGWTVHLGARDVRRGNEVAAELSAVGGEVRVVELDVTSDASVTEAARRLDALGPLDVLINNAGIRGPATEPLETDPSDFWACFDVNVLGPVRVTRAMLPLLRRSSRPRIVMVSSGMGSITMTTDPARIESTFARLVYPASKAALNMVTTQYAKALPEIRVNAVDPGYTATDFNDHRGVKRVEDGAAVIVAVAAVEDAATGVFLGADGILPW